LQFTGVPAIGTDADGNQFMTKATKTAHLCMCFAAALAAALPGIAKSATIDVSENRPMTPQRTTPPTRDPNIAVEEEYQLARQRGTAEALELFIARHPDSPLADKARADLRRMPR
jgi:hypothetical protein